jgi:hypothetical protein
MSRAVIQVHIEVNDDVAQGDEVQLVRDQLNETFQYPDWQLEGVKVTIGESVIV